MIIDSTVACNPKNYRKGRTGDIEYIVVHYTGNDGDSAVANGMYFASAIVEASAHYFVDSNAICRSVNDDDTAWHCGADVYRHEKCRNANSIGVEMCSYKDSSGVYCFKDETVRRAATLIKWLMAKYNIPIENVVRHYDVTGKVCPAPFVDNGKWVSFKQLLTISSTSVDNLKYDSYEEIPSWGKEVIKKLIDNKTLCGDDKGKLNISHNMLRILVILSRNGVL